MVLCWLAIFIIFLIVEILTVNLITIWFAFGAIAAMILSIFTNNIFWQVITFILISIICLLITKKYYKKNKLIKATPTNLDMVIGKIGITTKAISPQESGEVKVMRKIWTAVASTQIPDNTRVKILLIDGVKLVVEALKEEK